LAQVVSPAAGSDHLPPFPVYPGQSVLHMTRVEALTQCVTQYERARNYIEHHQSYVDFVAASRRLGHVRNELGKVAGREADMAAAELHWRAAQSVFEAIGDGENQAVLNINLAQLLRGRSATVHQEAGMLTVAARTHIAEAVAMYQKAFGALKNKHCNPSVWLMVQSELASTFEDFAVMLETNGARESWMGTASRQDAQLVVDLRNRALELLRNIRAPAWRLAHGHLALGTFYCATLHLGGGVVTRTRYDAAEGQLRKSLLLAGAASVTGHDSTDSHSSILASAAPTVAKRPPKQRQQHTGDTTNTVTRVLDPHSEVAVLQATAQLSLLLRVSGGPHKGTQALRLSLEALLSLRRFPLWHEADAVGTEQHTSAQQLAAWQAVAEALKGLTKELATMPAGATLGGQKEVAKDRLKDLFRQALKLKAADHLLHVTQLLELLTSLATLFA